MQVFKQFRVSLLEYLLVPVQNCSKVRTEDVQECLASLEIKTADVKQEMMVRPQRLVVHSRDLGKR